MITHGGTVMVNIHSAFFRTGCLAKYSKGAKDKAAGFPFASLWIVFAVKKDWGIDSSV